MGGADGFDGPPTVLVSLQPPLDETNGRILAAPVYTIGGSKKRKRAEISTTVDGGSISIHSLRDNRLVASYPVSPQTYFQSPPCSFSTTATGSRHQIRHTYAAIDVVPASSGPLQRPQLVHFAESTKHSDTAPPTQHKFDANPDNGSIFSLDVLPHASASGSEQTGHDVLAVHRNGSLLCLAQDLESVRWQKQLAEVSGDQLNIGARLLVEFSALLEVSQARKGILAGRQDVLANLAVFADSEDDSGLGSSVLVLVERRRDEPGGEASRRLRVLALQRHSNEGLTARVPPVRHLLSWDLPTIPAVPQDKPDSTPRYNLDASAGVLHQLLNGSITTFDLTGILPRVTSTLDHRPTPHNDFLALSPTRLLSSTDDACTIFDVKFHTVQAIQPEVQAATNNDGSKKRKRLSGPVSQPFHWLTLLSSKGLAVALQGTHIIGMQLSGADRQPRRRSGPRTLLIDALGKGTQPHSNNGAPMTKEQLPKFMSKSVHIDNLELSAHWQQYRSSLDEAFAAGDVPQFEKLFAKAVGVTAPDPKLSEDHGGAQVNGTHTSGDLHDELAELGRRPSTAIKYNWPTDRLLASHPQSVRTQAMYALGRMFSWNTPSMDSTHTATRDTGAQMLQLTFCPPNTFRWLVVNNFLTSELIGQAILRQDPSYSVLHTVTPAEISSALVLADPSTQLLYTLLTESTYLDVALLIYAIKTYVKSHTTGSTTSVDRKLLLAPPDGELMDVDDEDGDVETLLSRAQDDISRAESILDDTFELRTAGLKHALVKLCAFSRTKVTQALREELSTHEIRFLIHVLRIELQDGGWVSRYLDAGPAPLRPHYEKSADDVDYPVRSPSDSAITTVASLLSACVDAIGVGGWLTGPSSLGSSSPSLADTPDDLDPQELLQTMYHETVAVLEGLHEVNFINNAITDFLTYAERMRVSLHSANMQQRNKKARLAGELTKPASVHDDGADRLRAAIPMGGKVAETSKVVEPTKVKAPGVVKVKSKREIGMEISKKVGRYSFDRIRV